MFQAKWARTSTTARRLGIALCGLAIACGVQQVRAAIPDTERAALIDLYNSTNGANWTTSDDWLGPSGTECQWYGVRCTSMGNHVEQLLLRDNNLVGSLPSLGAFSELFVIQLDDNELTGALPALTGLTQLNTFSALRNNFSGQIPDLAGLSNLNAFYVAHNQLNGPIPSLSGLSNLEVFGASNNQLTGQIPSLGYCPALVSFMVDHNNLSGSIPSLANHSALQVFDVSSNGLTGHIPALSGLTSLRAFSASSNSLDGSLPSLAGHANLWLFNVSSNSLSGALPSLSGLSHLVYFLVGSNEFTGAIPNLSGLTSLQHVSFYDNHLTGSIPPLTGLTNLRSFGVERNELTGNVPSLQGLPHLTVFNVADNLLSGPAPALPSPIPNGFWADLCPNYLDLVPSNEWDSATGQVPWYAECAPLTDPGITVSPKAIYHEVIEGTAADEILTIGNTGTGNLHWGIETAVESCSEPSIIPWIAIEADAGTTAPGVNQNVIANLQSSGLAPGLYTAFICIHSDDTDHPEIEMPITLVVVVSEPNELLNPTSFAAEAFNGGYNSATLTITNSGNADLSWTLSAAQNTCGVAGMIVPWIQLDAVSGTAAANQSDEVGITFDAGSLSAGTYTASICVDSDDPDNAHVTLPVTFTVHPSIPVAEVDPSELNVKAQTGTVAEATLMIGNSGTADLNWTLDTTKEDCASPGAIAWILDGEASGSVAPDDSRGIVVGFDAMSLSSGSYQAALCLATDDPDRPMITVPVHFTVSEVPVDEAIFTDGFDVVPHGASARLH